MTKGEPDAPFTIIEFADYQCPGCGTFALRIKPRLDSAFIETGRAKLMRIDLPLTSIHPNALLAARAAHCAADQNGFWAYHDELYRQQDEWAPQSDPSGSFEGYAAVLGLDQGALRECMASGRHTDVVEANAELARVLGIRSTPTVVVRLEGGETRHVLKKSVRGISATIEEMSAGGPQAGS